MNISFPVPITYQVHRLRDGKSFASRKVDGIQKGNVIFTLMASFQVIYILLDLENFKFLVITLFSVVVNLALSISTLLKKITHRYDVFVDC